MALFGRRRVAAAIGAGVLAWASSSMAQEYKVKVTPAPTAPDAAGGQRTAAGGQRTAAGGQRTAAGGQRTAAAGQGTSDAGSDQQSSTTDGYSWSGQPSRPARHARRHRLKHYGAGTPIVTYPGFRVLEDGTTLIWVQVSRQVPVRVEKAAGKVTFHLEGAHVEVWNNTNPLITTHFATPVSSTQLRPGEAGARLEVQLREPVEVTHEVVRGPQDTMVLRVRVPPSQRPPPVHEGASMETTAPEPQPDFDVPAEAEAHAEGRVQLDASAEVSIGNKNRNKNKKKNKKKRRQRRRRR